MVFSALLRLPSLSWRRASARPASGRAPVSRWVFHPGFELACTAVVAVRDEGKRATQTPAIDTTGVCGGVGQCWISEIMMSMAALPAAVAARLCCVVRS